MTVFRAYAHFYDALYQDKDYGSECDFVEQVFGRYAGKPVRTVLDLGCGTGGHVLPLSHRGYSVVGVDRSEEMLEEARRKTEGTGATLQEGDIRDLALGRTFCAVISMFAVMSYMAGDGDFRKALEAARRHLEPGGLFVFDVWFGPAVLTDRPQDRYKVIERDGERIIRFVHPELDVLRHTVTVQYRVLRLRGERVVADIEERHSMRFLFPREITHYLDETGFELAKVCPFPRIDAVLSERDWNVAVVAKAR